MVRTIGDGHWLEVFGDDGWMPDREGTGLAHPRVEGADVSVFDGLARLTPADSTIITLRGSYKTYLWYIFLQLVRPP